MKRTILAASAAMLGAALLAIGYWWGANHASVRVAEDGAGAKVGRKILYYRNPMAPTDTSPAPKKAPDGMDFVPVYADEAAPPQANATKGKILYYRNPMGLPDTSPVPKKDPMGMDYIPVYAGGDEAQAEGAPLVRISVDKVQKLGVKTEAAAMRNLVSTVRAVATVQANEQLLRTVTARFDGWIQKLYVNTTGAAVRRGEPLMDVYSPDLIAAQQEYLIARKGEKEVAGGSPEVRAEMQRLVTGALQRLRNWDISDVELEQLERDGKARQYLTLRSPATGVILDKPSIQGKRFMAGEVLYQIADLSNVWLLADVFEHDLAQVHVGQSVQISVDAYPGKLFEGKVGFIYPTLNADTRTVKVRIDLANRQALLKPAMYARAEFSATHGKAEVLTVPESAVLDTGTRQTVLIARGEGRFEPRAVKIGRSGDGYVEVLDGVKVGEKVVVSANFLIDAESNLKAALSAFGQGADSAKPAQQGQTPPVAGAAGAVHRGIGTVKAVDAAHASVTLAHEAIASLAWPAMTMDFKVKDAALLRGLKPGERVEFELAGEAGGEYTIVGIEAAAAEPANTAAPSAADAHQGH